MVASQKLLVDSFGLKSLVAVVGPSMGGFQSFQWAASYPGFMKGIAASVTAPRAPGRLGGLEALQKRLASDPNWNGGWYYENGGIPGALEQIRYETLLNYGQDEATAKVAAKSWAKIYDGHSLVTLRRAIDGFDITARVRPSSRAPRCSTSISKTDKLFDITLCADHVLDMRKAGVDVTYVELPSDKGHMASHAGCRDVGADPRRLHEEPGMIEGAAALLRWYVEQGVDEAIGEEPIDRFAAPPPAPAAAAAAPAAPAAPRADAPARAAAATTGAAARRRCRSNRRSSSRMRARWPKAAAPWPSSRRRSAASRAAR